MALQRTHRSELASRSLLVAAKQKQTPLLHSATGLGPLWFQRPGCACSRKVAPARKPPQCPSKSSVAPRLTRVELKCACIVSPVLQPFRGLPVARQSSSCGPESAASQCLSLPSHRNRLCVLLCLCLPTCVYLSVFVHHGSEALAIGLPLSLDDDVSLHYHQDNNSVDH